METSLQLIASWFTPESVVTLIAALLASLAYWLFRPQVKVLWGRTSLNFHQFSLNQDQSPVSIATQKFFIQNVGRASANGVEIVLSAEPTSFVIYPSRKHMSGEISDGQFAVDVPYLAPGELLVLDVIDLHNRAPNVVAVNCPDVTTKAIDFIAQRRFPQSVYFVAGCMMVIGLVATIYAVVSISIGALTQ